MYNSGMTASLILAIKSVSSGAPVYENVIQTAVIASTTLSYYTDNTANFMQVSTGSSAVTQVILFFVDSYL